MRRTRPCWKTRSLVVGRQSVNSHATYVWAPGKLSLCGPKYLAARLCDALGVLEPARNQLPRGGCITLLSTVSVRTATVDGPNGRDGADRVVLVRVES